MPTSLIWSRRYTATLPLLLLIELIIYVPIIILFSPRFRYHNTWKSYQSCNASALSRGCLPCGIDTLHAAAAACVGATPPAVAVSCGWFGGRRNNEWELKFDYVCQYLAAWRRPCVPVKRSSSSACTLPHDEDDELLLLELLVAVTVAVVPTSPLLASSSTCTEKRE